MWRFRLRSNSDFLLGCRLRNRNAPLLAWHIDRRPGAAALVSSAGLHRVLLAKSGTAPDVGVGIRARVVQVDVENASVAAIVPVRTAIGATLHLARSRWYENDLFR